MKLLVVLVNYRLTAMTIDCLRSIAPQIGDVPHARVGVCENGTGEEAARQLQAAIDAHQWSDWAYVVPIMPNQGFTGGNNAVIGPALAGPDRPQYVLLLNNDTIVRPGAFKALVDFMDGHPEAGIAGSRLENPDGTPQVSAFRFQGIASELNRGLQSRLVDKLLRRWRVGLPIPEQPCRVPWVSGASLMIRSELLETLGLLDEGYFTYFDDIDLCRSAREHDAATWYVPASRVVHLVGQTTRIDSDTREKRRPKYWFQARRRYFLKHHGPVYAALVDAAFITGYAMFQVHHRLLGRPNPNPPRMLRDAIDQSVFRCGFKLPVVDNPALATSVRPC